VLQALTHQASGNTPGALPPLERALTLAEPEGYVRVFVGEGLPMATLLEAVVQHHSGWDYVRRLLAAFTQRDSTTAVNTPAGPATRLKNGLVEHLSAREVDVLRLLATDLDGPDIARQLFVSLNTVRTHTKSIYAKLGVNSRRAAVRRAEERGLLSRTGDL
jgi:LuxR family maltose regulon positive regulatory protein